MILKNVSGRLSLVLWQRNRMHCSRKLARVCHKTDSSKNFGHDGIIERLEIKRVFWWFRYTTQSINMVIRVQKAAVNCQKITRNDLKISTINKEQAFSLEFNSQKQDLKWILKQNKQIYRKVLINGCYLNVNIWNILHEPSFIGQEGRNVLEQNNRLHFTRPL